MNFINIPQELKSLKQWVLWKLEPKKDKQGNQVIEDGKPKYTKPLYQVNGYKASHSNPKHWNNFETIYKRFNSNGKVFNGIGFVFSKQDPYVGIDFDNCFDAAGIMSPDAKSWMEKFNSYTEYSQSKNGIHILVKGKLPDKGRKKPTKGYEIYDNERYFALTGDLLDQKYSQIEERQEVINEFFLSVFKEEEKQKPLPAPVRNDNLDLNNIIERCQRAKNGNKFNRLFSGDWAGFRSQSEADIALCNMIAFYTQNEAEIDSIFRQSGLYRDKWDERHGADTYGNTTIQKSLSGLTGTYSPGYNKSSLSFVNKGVRDENFAHHIENVPFPDDADDPDVRPAETPSSNSKLYTLKQIENWPWTESVYEYKDRKNLPYSLAMWNENGNILPYSYVSDEKYQCGLKGQKPILYRLPELIAATEKKETIFIVDREKDVNNLYSLGLYATSVMKGFKEWKKHYNNYFKDIDVIILPPDNDASTQAHAVHVANNLNDIANSIKIVNLGDVSDWIQAGGKKEDLLQIVNNTLPWEPPQVDEDTKEDAIEEYYTDMWNSEKFMEQHGGDIRYCKTWKKWLIFDKRWRKDEKKEIFYKADITVKSLYDIAKKEADELKQNKLLSHAKKTEGLHKRKIMMEGAEHLAGVEPEDFDKNEWLLNLSNGTLNLKTMELLPHDRQNYITKIVNTDYKPETKCPTWEKFLNRIFNGDIELIKFIQKAIGYSLTGSTREQCLFILHGTGANGKSTFVNTIEKLMGEYAKHTSSDTLMQKNNTGNIPNDIASLQGKRFVTSMETEANGAFAEVLVKELTGGDSITARFLYTEEFTFTNEGKIWIATNHKPKIKSTDYAIWRRIRLIPFNVTIPEEERDPDLLEKLKAEYEGILNWAVDGCLLWQQEGLKAPDEIKRATEDYRAEMDILAEFIKDCCITGKEFTAYATELLSAYQKYIVNEGSQVEISQKTLSKLLIERGFQKDRVTTILNKGKVFYKGIGIKDEKYTSENTQKEEKPSNGEAVKDYIPVKDSEGFSQKVFKTSYEKEKNNSEILKLSGKTVHYPSPDEKKEPQSLTVLSGEGLSRNTQNFSLKIICGNCTHFNPGSSPAAMGTCTATNTCHFGKEPHYCDSYTEPELEEAPF